VEVGWTKKPSKPSNEDGYEIWRSLGQEDNYKLLTTVSADKEMTTDTTVDPNNKYYYKARAYRGATRKQYSNFSNSISIDVLPASEIINNDNSVVSGSIILKVQK
ncbi:MAG: hypothetical protein NT120_00235, partial [Candidatus Aenigmarchaeota archaeon]|nr:hypothetical protein [Candidatus Aenigmarchaeota archaeon]